MLNRFFKLPNQLFSLDLMPADFHVFLALRSLERNSNQHIIASTSYLATLCNLHRNTVGAALKRLEKANVIEKITRYRKDGLYAASGYKILIKGGSFTKIPAFLLSYHLSSTQIAVYCYLKRCANQANRAFPSLRKIAVGAGVCLNTVLSAIKVLQELQLLSKVHYLRICGRFGCNNYELADQPEPISREEWTEVVELITALYTPFYRVSDPLFFFFIDWILHFLGAKQRRFLLHFWVVLQPFKELIFMRKQSEDREIRENKMVLITIISLFVASLVILGCWTVYGLHQEKLAKEQLASTIAREAEEKPETAKPAEPKPESKPNPPKMVVVPMIWVVEPVETSGTEGEMVFE